ncbi:EF-HAND CALCIUM-BINDING DOMAIN CONTAINING PROTEIN [Salix purpurea]|uniref:EF-HAND CALCIUM-BINDING DOMAIN CONTAINING PROTEIN n=1 Tax=Salix purpurea TaxID=77065 RepID=A0A9Q0P049_SALPP|nr:EF-HAND CALCIUM-BINDING DOMAIN CONTAINING PROTEIN [Salix purpurea]
MFPRTIQPKNIGKDCKAAIPASQLTEEQLIKIFRRFDTNEDGLLSKEEVKRAYNMLGKSFPGVRAWWALHVGDENGDGYISQKEFNKLVKKNYLT